MLHYRMRGNCRQNHDSAGRILRRECLHDLAPPTINRRGAFVIKIYFNTLFQMRLSKWGSFPYLSFHAHLSGWQQHSLPPIFCLVFLDSLPAELPAQLSWSQISNNQVWNDPCHCIFYLGVEVLSSKCRHLGKNGCRHTSVATSRTAPSSQSALRSQTWFSTWRQSMRRKRKMARVLKLQTHG